MAPYARSTPMLGRVRFLAYSAVGAGISSSATPTCARRNESAGFDGDEKRGFIVKPKPEDYEHGLARNASVFYRCRRRLGFMHVAATAPHTWVTK